MKYYIIRALILLILVNVILINNFKTIHAALLFDFIVIIVILLVIFNNKIRIISFFPAFANKTRLKYLFTGITPFLFGFIAQINNYLCHPNNTQYFIRLLYKQLGHNILCFITIPFYIVAMVLYIIIFRNKDNANIDSPAIFETKILKEINKQKYLLLKSIAIICLLFSVFLGIIIFYFDLYYSYFFFIWIIIIITPAILLFWDEKKQLDLSIFKLEKDEVFFIAMIFVFIASLLLPQLTTVPFVIHDDEGQMGNLARMFISNEVNIFALNTWNGFPNLGFYPMYITMKLFGDNIFGLRISGVLNGFICVIPFYYLARSLFNKQIAALSSIILFSSHIFIAFFRTGFHYSQSMVILILSLCALIVGFKLNSRFFLYLSGVFAALGIYLYFSSRIIIFLIIIFFVYVFIRKLLDRKTLLVYLLLVLTGFIITVTPLMFSFIKTPGLVNQRMDNINIFKGSGYEYMVQELKTDNRLIILASNIVASFKGLNTCKDYGEQYGTLLPFLEFYTSIFLYLSLPFLLFKFRNEKYFLLFSSFLLIFLGWVFTINAPTFQKMPVIMPIVAISATLVLYNIAKYIAQYFKSKENKDISFTVVTSIFVILIILSNFEFYFIEYIHRLNRDVILDKVTIAIMAMKEVKSKCDIYTINISDYPFNLYYENATFKFLSRGIKLTIIDNAESKLPIRPVSKDVCFFIQPHAFDELIKILEKYYPEGNTLVFKDNPGRLFMSIYFVKKEKINLKQ